MSRTNIVLDDSLVNKCQKATGITTKKALIDYALKELLRHENQNQILELRGFIEWEGSLSQMRKTRLS